MIRVYRFISSFFVKGFLALLATLSTPFSKHLEAGPVDFLKNGKYGLHIEYKHTYDQRGATLNTRVDSVDVEDFATRAQWSGASWVIWTMNHPSGLCNAPNAALDGYLQNGSATPNRDLISDLYDALNPKGIRLIVYVNMGGAQGTVTWASRMGWDYYADNGGHPFIEGKATHTFRDRWADVLEEWSLRYGNKVAGWWCDACLDSLGFDDTYFSVFNNALRAGNSNAIIAYNPGADRLERYTNYANYTAGELNEPTVLPTSRWVDGAQWHGMTYLGTFWGSDTNEFSNDEVAEYMASVADGGGGFSFNPNRFLPDHQLDQLKAIRLAVKGSGGYRNYYKFISKFSDKSFRVKNGGFSENTRVVQFDYQNDSASKWKFESSGGGYFRIKVEGINRYLTTLDEGTSNNTKVVIRNYRNKDAWKWKIEHKGDGWMAFKHKASGRYLTVPLSSNSNGTELVIYNSFNGNQQKWRIISLDHPQ